MKLQEEVMTAPRQAVGKRDGVSWRLTCLPSPFAKEGRL